MRGAILIVVAISFPTLSGCASMFLHGGRIANPGSSTAGALGAWDVYACSGADGRPFVPPSGVRYFLIQGAQGMELFEENADGSGVIVNNQWVAPDGRHFYVWVHSDGWEFVIPGAGQPALRLAYAGTGTSAGRPRGSYLAKCPMVPVTPATPSPG